MSVTLLFRCYEITRRQQAVQREAGKWEQREVGVVLLSPQYPQQDDPLYEETKRFYDATPTGKVEFATVNEAALAQFTPGKMYEIVVTERT